MDSINVIQASLPSKPKALHHGPSATVATDKQSTSAQVADVVAAVSSLASDSDFTSNELRNRISNPGDGPTMPVIGSRRPSKRRLSAMSVYQFSDLRPGYIRLLQVMPHPDRHASVRCQLFDYPFSPNLQDSRKATHLYEALSYFWGSAEKCRPVFVDDTGLLVTENLYAALLRLRDPFLPRTIWIDALCIDQDNPEERNHQVQLMAMVYARASCVLVWLEEAKADGDQKDGDTMTNGDRALEVIGHAAAHDWPTQFPPGDWEAVLALLQRSWFRRVWVLQEVAAARHVVILSRTTEIDGYAFCSGLQTLNTPMEGSDTQSRTHSITYLIKDAVLRPRHITSPSTSFSLRIRPLGELIDMYHDRQASEVLDKVYALLGMSSDTPVGLTPDYGMKWHCLFRQLIRSFIGEQAFVDTWDKEEVAIIESKGCVLGTVFETIRDDGQRVGITWKRYFAPKEEWNSHFTFPASAKPVEIGDAIYLLPGASKPIIVRPCDTYSVIIMIAIPPMDDSQESINWPELYGSVTTFPNDTLLVWDWNVSQSQSQDERYNSLINSRHASQSARQKYKNQGLDRAIKSWNVGLLLNAMERYADAGKHLTKAVRFYGMTVGTQGPCGEADEMLRVMKFLHTKSKGTTMAMKCKDGGTPLSWAVESGCEAVVQLLLEKGADIEARDNHSWTPLMYAAWKGYEAIVQLLLKKGANIEAKDSHGYTPLIGAALKGHEAVVQLLLEEGADIEARDNHSWTPLMYAARIRHEAIMQLLLKKGANIEAKDRNAWTPLIGAAWKGHEAVVQLLLKKGADIKAKDRNSSTPLMYAARNGHEAIVQLLLEEGADIKAKDNNGWTPLMQAAQNCHEAIMQLLLEKGADIEEEDNYGWTPLMYAAREGHEAVVQLLQRHAGTPTNLAASTISHNVSS